MVKEWTIVLSDEPELEFKTTRGFARAEIAFNLLVSLEPECTVYLYEHTIGDGKPWTLLKEWKP